MIDACTRVLIARHGPARANSKSTTSARRRNCQLLATLHVEFSDHGHDLETGYGKRDVEDPALTSG